MHEVDVKIIKKPWGQEIWLAFEDEYAGKILEVKKGARLSYQYHENKKETLYVFKGKMKLTHDGGDVLLTEGQSITLHPGDKHRIEALSDLKIIEVSTSHLDDLIRIEDDYHRVTKKE